MSIISTNGAYAAAATQTREATEKSVEVFKNTAKTFTDQLDQFKLPAFDLSEPVARYFEYLQKAVDLNRDLATKWAELVTTLSGSFREQAEKVTDIVKDQTDIVADLTVKRAEKAEQTAKEQTDKVGQAKREQEAKIEDSATPRTTTPTARWRRRYTEPGHQPDTGSRPACQVN